MTSLDSFITTQLPHITSLRRTLHQCPELEFQEFKTAAIVRHELDRLQIPFVSDIPGLPTATIAHIGDPSKPCLALRADIDALPITEATGLSYASQNPGRMHACGHDGHTAALLGAAAAFKEIENTLPVSIKLIFQPAEESGGSGGAEKLILAGALDGRIGPRPLAIFALHGWPGLPVGYISTRHGVLMAATDTFIATFHGKGCHGAFPHLGRDPIVAAAEGIITLQHIISREISPVDPALITVGQVSGGTAVNVIPEIATIRGTLRTLNHDTRAYIKSAILRRLEGIASCHDLRVELTWEHGYPPTVNHPRHADFVAATVRSTFGPDAFIPTASPCMGGEDFSYYLEKIPGCFILIGLRPPQAIDAPGLHHPLFNFNDNALPIAIKLLVGLGVNAQSIF